MLWYCLSAFHHCVEMRLSWTPVSNQKRIRALKFDTQASNDVHKKWSNYNSLSVLHSPWPIHQFRHLLKFPWFLCSAAFFDWNSSSWRERRFSYPTQRSKTACFHFYPLPCFFPRVTHLSTTASITLNQTRKVFNRFDRFHRFFIVCIELWFALGLTGVPMTKNLHFLAVSELV